MPNGPTAALIFGSGNGLDRAITRELALSGMPTLTATRSSQAAREAMQPDLQTSHWSSIEDVLDVSAMSRLARVLQERGHRLGTVIAEVDLDAERTGWRRVFPHTWKHWLSPKLVLREVAEAIAAAVGEGAEAVIIVGRTSLKTPVHRLRRWIESATRRAAARFRHRNAVPRINAVIIEGGHATFSTAARFVARLCQHPPLISSITPIGPPRRASTT